MTIAPAAGADSRRGGASGGHLWRRLGLRARVTLLFTLGAFLLSLIMGGLSYFTARHFLVNERQSASYHQTYLDATQVRNNLKPHQNPCHNDGNDALESIDLPSGTSSVLVTPNSSCSSFFSVEKTTLPVGLRALVASGTPATQNIVLGGVPQIAVGVPIPAFKVEYYEVFDVGDLQHTLRILLVALAAAGVVTTVLGAAVGRSASARSLRPLTGVSRAAMAIASGALSTRLPEATGDPDLAGLTSSFNQMVDQLETQIEREARFTSDVSHELRSPLTTLSATLTVLEDHRDELDPRAQQALALLGEDLRRFQRMVGDLLEISRSDTRSADVSAEEVQVGELVRQAVGVSTRTLPPDVVPPDLLVDPSVDTAWVSVDKRRFERVIANLLENAALYGDGATLVAVQPGLGGADGSPTVEISVADRGPGVEPAERTRVFERFYRGQASGRRGAGTGTGLGLSLVAEHVRLNGGRVWVDEAEGGGARFVVELPLEDAELWR